MGRRALRMLGRWTVISLLLFAAAAHAQDDPPARVGRIAALSGEVWVLETESREWVAAARNRPFTQGERLATATGGSAELQVGSSTLVLDGDSEIEASRLDDERLQFALLRGSAALRLHEAELASDLELFTPEARFLPLRAGLYRIERRGDTSSASNWRGLLRATTRDVVLTLEPGRRLQLEPDASGALQARWSQPAEDAFATAFLREAEVAGVAPDFVSPEMTGVAELARHGSWSQHADFGWAWSPTVIAPQWAPYRFGQWVWVQPWGWTWVDDAPWGFAPFHYGRWFWSSSRWFWTPGPRRARPVYAPALVGWGGGQSGIVVGGRPAPVLGWVPLGPREAYRPGYRASPGYVARLNPHGTPVGAPPAFANRGVPGAVTVWPGATLAPRQPVGASAWRADEATLRRLWQDQGAYPHAPGRPMSPPREVVVPRASTPYGSGPTDASPVRPRPPTAAPVPRPAPVPGPTQGVEAAPPAASPTAGPFHGRPLTTAPPASTRERLPQQVSPPVPVPASPVPAAAAVKPPPAAAPVPPAKPEPKPGSATGPFVRNNDTVDARPGGDPNERRRTPESRAAGRER